MNKKLHELELELKTLIDSNPKYREYQNQINQKLMLLTDPVDRLAVLCKMMNDNLAKMEDGFSKILKLLGE